VNAEEEREALSDANEDLTRSN
jgi:predicted  nucleic acid-binding Zn-ribbon protein